MRAADQALPTVTVTARARELRAAGHDVISLGAGEPDFGTPDFIKEAAIRAIREGFTKYTAVDGIPQLKQAVVDKFRRDNDLSYQPKQILISCGGKQGFSISPGRRAGGARRGAAPASKGADRHRRHLTSTSSGPKSRSATS